MLKDWFDGADIRYGVSVLWFCTYNMWHFLGMEFVDGQIACSDRFLLG